LIWRAGGDPDAFKVINEAYDVLKDPEKRKIYDQVRCGPTRCAGQPEVPFGIGSRSPILGLLMAIRARRRCTEPERPRRAAARSTARTP
jgi:curved DNA-binding protein CbpA